MTLSQVMEKTDWKLLAQQKLALIQAINVSPSEDLDGLLHWMDAIQDAAEEDGFPVVYLTD